MLGAAETSKKICGLSWKWRIVRLSMNIVVPVARFVLLRFLIEESK
jgi:hypothetical protein